MNKKALLLIVALVAMVLDCIWAAL